MSCLHLHAFKKQSDSADFPEKLDWLFDFHPEIIWILFKVYFYLDIYISEWGLGEWQLLRFPWWSNFSTDTRPVIGSTSKQNTVTYVSIWVVDNTLDHIYMQLIWYMLYVRMKTWEVIFGIVSIWSIQTHSLDL